MIKLGIFAKTFKISSSEELFSTIKSHQLEVAHYNMACVGLNSLPTKEVPADTLKAIYTSAQKNQLEIIGLSATFNMIHPNPQVRANGLKSLEILAQACTGLGTNFLSLCTGSRDQKNKWKWHPDNAQPEAWTDLLNTMQKALEIAEKYNLILGVEPETANVVQSPQKARQLLDEMQSKHLKIILDPANLFETVKSTDEINQHIAKAIELLADDIAIAHAKDRTLDGVFKAAGKGDIDFEFFIQQLKSIGFDGPLVLHGLEESEVGGARDYLRSYLIN